MRDNLDLGGAVMVGLDGTELTANDRHRLAQPAVGAVCLFSRNFQNSQQLAKLITSARDCVSKDLVFAADHEGGRVQRFVSRGFTRLKPARHLGDIYKNDKESAIAEARDRGKMIARQLGNVGVDLSLAPVLDLDHGRNEMIAERCFGSDPETVTALGIAFCAGLAEHGASAVGKHFPGHGWAKADSHFETPTDGRPFEAIFEIDVKPYEELISVNALSSVMLSHVVYTDISDRPATSSPEIAQGLLRDKIGYEGLVMTDDLVMEGAGAGIGLIDRTIQSKDAGCDLILWCGGEPVLFDNDLARLPASNGAPSPWLKLRRAVR